MSTATIVNKFQQERDALERSVKDLIEKAEAEGADLTDDDLTALEGYKTRMLELDRRIDVVAEDFHQNQELQRKVADLGKVTEPGYQYRSAGDAVIDLVKQHRDPDAKRRLQMAQRAAEHMGTTKVATTATAGGFDGLVFVPNVGAVILPDAGGMPFLDFLGLQRAPSASFNRLYVDDPNLATGVAKQALQKGELASKAFEVKAETLNPDTYGGYLNLSRQAEELVPGSLDLVIRVLRRRLAVALEVAGIATVTGTGATPIATPTDSATAIKAIYDAVAAYTTATGENAGWIAMGPTGYALLGGMVDLAGRPLFPMLGASNAPGTSTANSFTSSVAGLRAIVTPAITDAKIYIGGGSAMEAWYYPLPVLEAVEPSLLGRQVAVAAMAAFHQPAPYADSIQVIGT